MSNPRSLGLWRCKSESGSAGSHALSLQRAGLLPGLHGEPNGCVACTGCSKLGLQQEACVCHGIRVSDRHTPATSDLSDNPQSRLPPPPPPPSQTHPAHTMLYGHRGSTHGSDEFAYGRSLGALRRLITTWQVPCRCSKQGYDVTKGFFWGLKG